MNLNDMIGHTILTGMFSVFFYTIFNFQSNEIFPIYILAVFLAGCILRMILIIIMEGIDNQRRISKRKRNGGK